MIYIIFYIKGDKNKENFKLNLYLFCNASAQHLYYVKIYVKYYLFSTKLVMIKD